MSGQPSDGMENYVAEREITRVLHLYCRGVDRLDTDALRATYHAGATDDHGVYVGTAEGFIDYLLERLPRVYLATQHALSNITIDLVDPSTAIVESYVHATHLLELSSGGSGLYIFTGRYIDRFERRDGSWRIAHRKLLRTWDGFQKLSRTLDGAPYELPAVTPHTDGRRDRSDPVYVS